LTSTRKNAWKLDGVAADPRLLPYGTIVDIPGVGRRVVDDTGGGMRRSARRGILHLDVRFSTVSEAREWGERWLMVKVCKIRDAANDDEA
jgi:cystine transport system substrate-binding protein